MRARYHANHSYRSRDTKQKHLSQVHDTENRVQRVVDNSDMPLSGTYAWERKVKVAEPFRILDRIRGCYNGRPELVRDLHFGHLATQQKT